MSEIMPIEVSPEMKIKVLTDEKMEKIHQATLAVLEESGIKFPSQKALKIFADAGARVDFSKQIVKFPPDLLTSSLSKAPRAFTMASRCSSDLDLYLDGTKTYIGTDGTGTTTVDLETRERRASKKKDVELMALISDYLPGVSFYWPLVSAQDMPASVIPLHELDASFNFTEKHVHIISCVEEHAAKFAVEMAAVVAGGRAAMKKRPPLSLLVCTVAPLSQDKGALESALVFADAGLPVGFMSMPSMCSTSPASVAGNMVVGNAEILSALCLIQLAYPGAPVYYSYLPEMLNPHTGGIFSPALQKPLMYAGGVDMGHFYNLPVMAYYGGTDSRTPDEWQTGKDNAIDAIFVCLTGPEVIPVIGLLEAYTLVYPEKILFDNEIVSSIKETVEGVKVNEETIALDEIMAVGPGGHYLNREHTKINLRKLYKPGIANRWSPEDTDFLKPSEASMEKIKWIVENHKPKPLTNEIQQELKKIIQSADKELSS
ncbi:MAG TPA: hypothetical protein ENI15_12375 [Spirochaetes bacterium]|nr:hypothetical protein [Spirochaetota bacterium]